MRKIKFTNKGKNKCARSLYFSFPYIYSYTYTRCRKKVTKMFITTCLLDCSRKTMKQNLLVARLNFSYRLYFYRWITYTVNVHSSTLFCR